MSAVRADVVVVGGGVVGAAATLALARAGFDVELVEARPRRHWQAHAEPDLRVFAVAPSSARLFDELGVWDSICQARVSPYHAMHVCEQNSAAVLDFDAASQGRAELGWIVENSLLVDRLWQGLDDAGVKRHCPAQVADVRWHADRVEVELGDGELVRGRLLVAADGARSATRGRAGIDCWRRDYHQRGVVAHVACEKPHDGVAWQRFLETGPLALLPMADGRRSIVWTLPDAEARRVLDIDDGAFMDELGVASDFRFGRVTATSKRAAFPLQLQVARQFHAPRLVLVGDAAHAVHPLAGQGVNLGLRDVAELRDVLAQAGSEDVGDERLLARYARRRRSASTLDGLAFDAIERSFAWQSPALAMARAFGLRAVNRSGWLKAALAAHAAG